MRALSILCGIAVLLNALHFAHFLVHFHAHFHEASTAAWYWPGLAAAVIVDVFSLLGGFLLLRRAAR